MSVTFYFLSQCPPTIFQEREKNFHGNITIHRSFSPINFSVRCQLKRNRFQNHTFYLWKIGCHTFGFFLVLFLCLLIGNKPAIAVRKTASVD